MPDTTEGTEMCIGCEGRLARQSGELETRVEVWAGRRLYCQPCVDRLNENAGCDQ